MRRIAPIAPIALAVALLSFVSTVPASAGSLPLPSNATLVVPGHGWGHARGMGQWGAKGMADVGKTYGQILTHFYSGITIGTRSASEDIRALVESSADVVVTADDPFKVSWSNGTLVATSDATYPFFRVRYDGTVYRVERSASHTGPWSLVKTGTTYAVFTRGPSLLQLVFDAGNVRYYRGKIIARYSSTGAMLAINELLLQEYLYGVVPREMPASWPAEAVKSQAVSARTYAVYKKDNARSKGLAYDICSTTQCQVYGGFAMKSHPTVPRTYLEHAASNAAVDATAGKVLLYDGKPILAEYSSSSGGYTAPGTVAYQRAVPDAGDAVSPHHNWRATIRVSEVEAKWPSIGRLVDVKVTRRNGYGDWGGRVLEMQLVGTAGTVTMSGHAWRRAFEWPSRAGGVRSNWFAVLYWRGELVSAPSSVAIPAGDAAAIIARVKNTGNTSWPVGGTIRLATPAASRFAGPGWISATRPASVSRNVTVPSSPSVAPGQVAEFRIPLHTNDVPVGLYRETFTAIADGASTMTPSFTVSVQVLPAWIDEAPNLLTNGSFESRLAPWRWRGLVAGDGVTTAVKREGTASFRFGGGGSKSIAQPIAFAGGTGRRFVLGGWSRTVSSSPSGGAVELLAAARYTDGSAGVVRLPFSRSPHAWTYDELAFTTSASKQLATVTVGASYLNQTGEGYFDAIRLLESPIANPSFEDGLGGWGGSGLASGDGPTTSAARDGVRSLALGAGGAKRVIQYLPLSGLRSERVVLSAWNRADAPSALGGPIAVALTLINTDGTRSATSLEFPKAAHGWTLGEVTVAAPKHFSSAVVTVVFDNQTGTAFFDAIRISKTWTANPSFENGLTGWSSYGFGSGDGVVSAVVREGAGALALTGAGRQGVLQQLSVAGNAGARYVVSGWNRAAGTSGGGGMIGLTVAFRNTDGTTSWVAVPFARTPHEWTYREQVVAAQRRFSRVDVYVVFYDQTGSGTFDGIRLRRA